MKNEKWFRIFLGTFLIIYALNKFVQIVPTSYGYMPEITKNFLDAIIMYLPFLYFFEIVVGILLIFNKWSSLILIMLFPLSITFLMFNVLNGNLMASLPAVLVAALNFILVFARKDQYKVLLN